MPFSNISFKVIICTFSVLLAVNFNTRLLFPASSLLNFEAEKCPFCFGETLCDVVDDVEISINIFDYIIGFLNRKFVFLGSLKNQPIVIKRLAQAYEKKNLDKEIANLLKYFTSSSEFRSKWNADFYNRSLQLLNQSFFEPSNKLRICPTLENVDTFFSSIIREHTGDEVYINIWTSLILNPEPLLLQIFRYEDGWHVPKYIGSCGHIALIEYCGKTIDNYVNHPWLFRVHIVQQLLEMAHSFTFTSSDYGVYFRDISSSNIVLDADLKTRIIDLEHVIVVDKNSAQKNVPETWFSVHTSENFDCDDCITYSPMKICNHHISDHNFYAVCKEFLHSIYPKDLGLLHSASDEKYHTSVLEELRFYIGECIHPSKTNNRFEIANKLSDFLNKLLRDGDFKKNEFKKLI